MPSLENNFKELIDRIQQGREFSSSSFEPVYYLVFHPREILDVKRTTPAWTARLKNDGWNVHRFSMAEHVLDILGNHPLRKVWLGADRQRPLNWERTNQAMANALEKGQLAARLKDLLDRLKGNEKAIVLVTDVEALHPYMRIGAIEGQLAGSFSVPTVILYPGERTGKSKLRFLGFYPDDGNYRSVHVGG